MTLESNFWRTANLHLSPFGKLKRIENSAEDGTADAIYVLTRPKPGSLPATGLLELKVADLPVRPLTPLRPRHLEKDQVLAAEEWAKAGGRSWLLVRARPWVFLFDVQGIRSLFEGEVASADAPAIARVAAAGKFPTGPILKELTR